MHTSAKFKGRAQKKQPSYEYLTRNNKKYPQCLALLWILLLAHSKRVNDGGLDETS